MRLKEWNLENETWRMKLTEWDLNNETWRIKLTGDLHNEV